MTKRPFLTSLVRQSRAELPAQIGCHGILEVSAATGTDGENICFPGHDTLLKDHWESSIAPTYARNRRVAIVVDNIPIDPDLRRFIKRWPTLQSALKYDQRLHLPAANTIMPKHMSKAVEGSGIMIPI